jgi:hypothetical protein
MREKFPLKILEKNNQFKVATSLEKIKEKSRNIRQELSYLELDYTILMKTVRETISISSGSKKLDPRFYWLVGDYTLNFISRIDDLGYYLLQQNQTLSKSMGISQSSFKKILSFRKRFPKMSLVNPGISWAKYRDNKVPILKDHNE